MTLKSVYKNRVKRNHAESLFLRDLRKIRNLKKVKEIQAHLVQNYSPCNKCKQEQQLGCADDILTFKDEMLEKGINFSLTITFANFYKHWKDANKKGLINLRRNGIKLELLQGESKWKQFLSDESFVNIKADEHEELFAKATSDKRKNRENDDEEIFQKLLEMAGEQTAKVYILIRLI